jgi:hypothetical protein
MPRDSTPFLGDVLANVVLDVHVSAGYGDLHWYDSKHVTRNRIGSPPPRRSLAAFGGP